MTGSAGEGYGNLLVVGPDHSRQEVSIDRPEFRIGRGAQCHLTLQSPAVLNCHAILLWSGASMYVSSAATDSPILVNEVPVSQQAIENGDVLTIGDFRLVYRRQATPVRSEADPNVPPPAAVPVTQRTAPLGLVSPPTPRRNLDPQLFKIPLDALKIPEGATKDLVASGAVSLVLYTPLGTYHYPLAEGAATTIGAAPDNRVAVTFADGVKPHHARVEWEDRDALVVANDHLSEIWVNGELVTRHRLTNGDFVKIGEARFVFQDTRTLDDAPALLKHTLAGLTSSNALGKTIRVGRDPSNDIVLNHLQVSRFHAEVQKRNGSYFLVDLGSSNGTFLNGNLVDDPVRLKADDHIRISDFHLHFDGNTLEHYSEEGNARIDAIDLRREVGKDKVILHDISFSIYPREFVALVGVSGAGKSTMMNALSGFRPADKGLVLVNGIDYYAHFDSFRSTLGFVPQDDIIHLELPVYRALYYAARLRFPEDTKADEIKARLEEVLSDLHLTERRDTPIHRLSGGQRKRVSIGVELLTRPRLFYLDEPTSGLDPGMETDMMRIFRDLADKGHTLIVITHATKNIMMCDKIIFLAAGGRLAFFGSPAEALQYFHTDDFSEIYHKVEREKSPEQWAKEFRQSSYYKRNVEARQSEVQALEAKARQEQPREQKAPTPTTASRVSLWRQFVIVTRRYTEIMLRDKTNLAILLGSAIMVAVLIAVLFPSNLLQPFVVDDYDIPGFTTGSKNLNDVMQAFSTAQIMTFFIMVAPIFFGTNNALREIAREVAIYKRERTVNLRILPYVMSKVVTLSGVCMLQVLFLEAILGFHFKFPTQDVAFYLKLFLALFVSSLAAMSLGLAFSAVAPNETKAGSALPLLIIPQLFLTGYMPKLVGAAKMLTYVGFTRWSFDILAGLFQLWEVFPSEANISDPTLLGHPQIAFMVDQGKEFHNSLNFNFWGHVGILGAEAALLILVTCIFLTLKDKVKD